jgi:hypothetical protein
VNRLLQAWGWADALIEPTRGTVLVEMKSWGRALERDLPHLQRYWIYCTPK